MTLPNVETFEHDIAAEIIKKESTVSKAASVQNLVNDVAAEVTPKQESNTSSSTMLVFIILIVVALVGVGGYFGYTYYINIDDSIPSIQPQKQTKAQPKNTFATTFPDLDSELGRYITRTEKNPYGYALTLNDYTPVFSYTIKNEESFARAIARVLPTGLGGGEAYTFSDVTISNQNMRIGVSGSSTVAYAFIGTNTLIISTSTEGLSSIASAIIK